LVFGTTLPIRQPDGEAMRTIQENHPQE
jgi:hypothetical protein